MSRVERRDVYFFPGYDIAGVKRYHRYLVRQSGWYARRFDVEIDVSPLAPSNIDHWFVSEVIADWPDGRVTTRFHFCDWRADVARDYAPNGIVRTVRMLRAICRMTLQGQTRRVCKAAPLFAASLGVPLYLFVLRLLVVMAGLFMVSAGGVTAAIGGALAGLALYGLWHLGDIAYETFFGSYVVYLDRELYGGIDDDPGMLDAAIAALAAHPADARIDETLIAGHSYGGAPAAKAAAALGDQGRDVSLLTVGSISPCVALEPNEQRLRSTITKLYEIQGLTWRDFFAPQDSLCFPNVDPVKHFSLSPQLPHKANVKVASAIFDDFVSQRKIRKFRWNLLRMHFQFMMAADKQGKYDWHRFTLGPERLGDATR